MAVSRRTSRGLVCVVAVALLGAGDPPPGVPSQTPAAPPPAVPQPIQPGGPGTPILPPGQPVPPPRQFDLKFDTKASAKFLLPVAPKVAPVTGPVLTDDLKKIPEIDFQAPQKEKDPTNEVARQIAKINHVNAKKADAFMAALLENRPDLAGVPFAMGDDCRTDGDRLRHFTQAAQTVRQAMGAGQQQFALLPARSSSAPPPVNAQPPAAPPVGVPQAGSGSVPGSAVITNFLVQTDGFIGGVQPASAPLPFWQQYNTLCDQEDTARGRTDKEQAEHVTLARVAALTQMLAAEPAEVRLGLVKYLTGVPHVESTKALARMAIFSAEDDIRAAAVTALKVRRERDYTDILVKGLRYPWPAVARRAAEVITKLERTDLVPDLVAVLDSADPRLPTTRVVGGKTVAVVREMVKMNHHRNCLMCHAPVGSGVPNPSALTAEVAVPGQPLPLPAEGYRQSTQELLIRLDVTYLRQDFSATLPVREAHPWPEGQRFDFFVRERQLTEDEAAAYRDQLAPKGAGVLSPYHKAAVVALRELTGKDTAPAADAWRKLLAAPAPR